jgi:uncharacterized membrane protein YgcG
MGATRSSSRQIKRLWVTGSVALGVVAISSGAAMASMANRGENPGTGSDPSATPGTELCLHLDQEALEKIHQAEQQAQEGAVDVRLPSDVATTCPDSGNPGGEPGTDPGGEPGTDPGGEPGTDPGTNPGGEPGTNPGGGDTGGGDTGGGDTGGGDTGGGDTGGGDTGGGDTGGAKS